jgi:hypothetical protein
MEANMNKYGMKNAMMAMLPSQITTELGPAEAAVPIQRTVNPVTR